MQNSHVIILTAIIILGLFSAGCTSSSQNVNTPVQTLSTIRPEGTVAASDSDFTLVESHTETGQYGNEYVAGTIKNNDNKEFSYVQVTINEYDASGAQIGSTLANVDNLEAYGTWKFQAPVLDSKAVSFKVKQITGW